MKTRKFVVQTATKTLLSADEHGNSRSPQLLVSLDGWEGVSVQLETVPKLFGSGSYLVSHRIGERTISIEVNVEGQDPKAVLSELDTAARLMRMVTLTREFYKDGTLEYAERLKGYVTSTALEQIEGNGTIGLTVRVLDPNFQIIEGEPGGGDKPDEPEVPGHNPLMPKLEVTYSDNEVALVAWDLIEVFYSFEAQISTNNSDWQPLEVTTFGGRAEAAFIGDPGQSADIRVRGLAASGEVGPWAEISVTLSN